MPVAKGLGTTGASSGECGHIAVFNTVLEIGAEHEFVREAGVETVARADGIHRLNRQGRRKNLIFAAPGNCAVWTTLDHNDRNEPR